MVSPADSFAVLAALALALASWPTPSVAARSRLVRLCPPVAEAEPEVAEQMRVGRRPLLFAGAAGLALFAAVPSLAGGMIAALLSVGSYFLLWSSDFRRRASAGGVNLTSISMLRWSGAPAGSAARADPRLASAIDLLAVCLRAGMPASSALRAVATVVAGRSEVADGADEGIDPAAVVFARVAAASELGSDPASAWERWIGHPVYGPLARALVVTGESGSAVAARLEGVANQLRTAAQQRATVGVQRAGVALMAPLGLCFLPAFVCLGVGPVVVGIAGQVFG